MAQTGYTPILIYSSTTAAQAPLAADLTNSTLGSELAINITDGKLFYKDNANAVQVIGWKVTPTSAGGTGLTSYAAGDMLYYASGTALSKLTIGASGRYLSSTGSAPQWSAPAALTKTDDTNVTLTLGGSASTALLNAASLTLGWTGTLATTRGGTGLSSFTANGVFYATSTSAIGQSANLTFNGTTLSTANVTASGELVSTTNDARISLYRSAGTNYFDWASGQSLYFSTQTSQGGAGRSTKVAFFDSGGVSIGNTTDPGATNLYGSGHGLFGTSAYTGSASNTKYITAGVHSTVNGTTSVPSGTPTTAVTLPDVSYAAWLVSIAISTGAASTWSSSYIVVTQGTSSNIGTLVAGSGSGLGIQMSGLNLQLKQSSGATFTMGWSATRIF